jgi:protein-tyrosine phosphatase
MINRFLGWALLMLALAPSLGCGDTPFRSSQGHSNQGWRSDAAVEAVVRYAADGPADVLPSVDSTSDGEPRDSDPGKILDSFSADDGQSDGGESADTSDDPLDGEAGRACGRSPWTLLDGVPNVRQLGGLPLVGGGSVACDLIYRGSYLSGLTQQGCGQFADTGINTVVDMRSESEQTSPPAACITELAQLVSAPMPTPYNVSPADYLADLYTAASVQKAFAVLANRAAYPVYYHCLYGKDRTGVLTAVILSALGASRQTIGDEYAMSGEAGFAYYPASLNAVLDELDRLGGVDAYFRAVGVPDEHVQSMRAILLAGPR